MAKKQEKAKKTKKKGRTLSEPLRGAVIGYGGAFNMGRAHCQWMEATGRMKAVAVCDVDEARLKVAQEELPGIATYTDAAEMLARDDIDLVTVILPHNLHASVAIQCAEAGKHVIVEKPMCLTVEEATAMIHAAQRAGVMLSVFHNRRWDGDFMALREIVQKGLLGQIFHVEMYGGGYGHPGTWWRSDKAISGGAFYDWGAHFLDWLLNLMPGKVSGVTGFFHKLKWWDVTNEDNVEAAIRFEDGAVAYVQMGHLARLGKPRWKLLGTDGAVVDEGGHFRVVTEVAGYPAELRVPYQESTWNAYYVNIAEHLLDGAELVVKPEQARRVIALIEAAEKSSASGVTQPVPYE
jgi:scyllo-inositol 2-dehydrogenase (NADP+)